MFNDKDIKALAYEKSIEPDRVYAALEDALSTAARKYYKTREPVEAKINRADGTVVVLAVKEIVSDENEIEDPQAQWTLDQARKFDASAEIGSTIRLPFITKEVVDVVKDPNTQIRTYEAQKLDPEVEQGDEVKITLSGNAAEFGRIAAQSAKQVLYQKVREAEREKVFNEFKDKMGELENGYVKRFERGDMIIDLNGKTEGIIPRSQQSRAERYSQGDRIKAVIVDVHTQPKGPQIVLSRTDPRLLIKLFEMEVPEIYDGTVVIKGAVREPGERAKIAVMSRERDVDPVGACVGMKGSRVQSIIRELRGEKIDIIEYSDDLVTFAQSALAPAKITRVSVTHHGEYPHLDVIVEDEQLSLAIGKRGQNVRLASELIGCRIDIKSESDVKDEVADALARMLQTAMSGMAAEGAAAPTQDIDTIAGITPEIAEGLREAGLDGIEALLDAPRSELLAIEGIDEALADRLVDWAQDQTARREADAAEIGKA
ncbi:MAG TPA: transcription termination factor NusA, partial [Thermoanaerobaculia bacterium]|nr:transcription termination factor NusA [Thermoanaerobaculia bacterium]